MRILIDGHNLIGQMPEIDLADPDDEHKLVLRLRQFANRKGHSIMVLFDGGLPGGPSRELSGGGVEVQFAPSGRAADPLIINRLSRLQPGNQDWLVVSSDHAILKAAERYGVRRERSEVFAERLDRELVSEPEPEADQRLVPPSKDEVSAWLREFEGR